MNDKADLVRKLSVISLFIDNYLLDKFVLKGGNAISLAFGNHNRASTDIDVSMGGDFTPEELVEVTQKLEDNFITTFEEEGLKIYDFKLISSPKKINPEYEGFWGGYTIEFKCIDSKDFDDSSPPKLNKTRTSSIPSDSNSRKFTIDISKYEYVSRKTKIELDGYTIYVYTPVMVVYEKLRAICQQMNEYRDYVATSIKPRAKDFFDIYTVVEEMDIRNELFEKDNLDMIREIFKIKRVPLNFLYTLENYREFHKDSFNLVEDTVPSSTRIETYDYYFDYVKQLVEELNTYLAQDEQQDEIG